MSNHPLASIWASFNARTYLQEYYGDVGPENLAYLQFFARQFGALSPQQTLLDFGSGPTIYSVISAVPKVERIVLSDYVAANREELVLWRQNDPQAFDWTPFITAALQVEGMEPTAAAIAERTAALRQKIVGILFCDAALAQPLPGWDEPFDVLVSNSCADAATNDRATWQQYLNNILTRLKPGGTLLLSAVKGADFGDLETALSTTDGDSQYFPTVNIVETDLREALVAAGCAAETIAMETVPADRPTRKYQGLMMATARKAG
ncbi:MAG: guanitoxin biosynthesis pre-guanitoxin forming N-methyltransferase GntF [Pseudanabaenaceae cyanobacterium]